jgi:MinD-like ATPase involved in chromosome partitioning or flagellar assembly
MGRVLALVGGKGAPGVTTVAIGLARVLAAIDRRGVVLVDADLRAGNVVPYLDLDPSHGILGLAVARQGATGLPAEDELQDGPGFRVMAGIERPETYQALTPELITAALTRLRELSHFVLIDAGQLAAATSSPFMETVIRQSDGLLLVTGADLVSVWNAQCCWRFLREELGFLGGAVGAVVNRFEKRGQYSALEIEQALGIPVLGVIPEDRRAAQRAAAEQVPLGDTSRRVASALNQLARGLVGGSSDIKTTNARRRWPRSLKTSMVGRQ